MESLTRCFVFIFFLLTVMNAGASDFRSGEEKIISKRVNDNLYVAAASISIDAMIQGDLIAAGGTIIINDTVTEDLIAAGGDILINGWLGDDARVFGENIKILKGVNGELIVCGNNVRIGKDVVIKGDVVIFAAYAVMNGITDGNLKFMGGEFSLNGLVSGSMDVTAEELKMQGIVQGASKLVANSLLLEKETKFYGNVEYWQRGGEMDFAPFLVSGKAFYNQDLELSEGEAGWQYFGLGMITFWILYTLSVFLALIVFVFLFSSTFSKTGSLVTHSYFRNFGYGAAYFIGLPLLTFFLLITVIGIPLAMITLHLYLFSLFFAYTVSSLILTEGIKDHYKKNWGKWKTIFAAALVFLILKLITFVPFIGIFIAMLIIGMAYGSLLYHLVSRKKHSTLNT